MQVTTPIADQLGAYLDLSALQLKVTAENMANIDTPGYRTMGFDFAEAMQQSIEELEAPGQKGIPASSARLGKVGGLLERPDGNNVSVDREGLKMAEAQLQFRTGLELMKREFTRVMDAIHVDQK